ncbi:hypothetical protein [Methanobacterium sp. MBAC-LM]|uniref:hypothetical protein n=1 Tax=Methanobacterium sp. MBAC-LM TaxID=3412034 RepID=UPI003C7875A9
MEDNKKIEIIKEGIKIAESLVSPFDESPESRKVESKGLLFWVEEANNHYNPLVGKIFRYCELKKNFSSDYVRGFIDDLVSDILKAGIENVKKDPLIVDIFDDNFSEITMYLPISGIEMIEKEELIIGNIVFKKMTEEMVIEIADKLEKLTRDNPYVENKEESVKRTRKYVLSFKDKICAEYKLFAEQNIVFDNAKMESEKSLDLLNFASIFLHHKDHNITIALGNEVSRIHHDILSFKSNYRGYSFTKQFTGPIFNFRISPDSIDHLTKLGIFKASEILKKPENDLTEFEKNLLLGIHWIANFQSQRELENQYLSLAVALEIFLTPDSAEPVSVSIAEAASMILGHSIERKKSLKERIKVLYGKRSDIVHGRSDKLPTEGDLVELRNILIHLTLWMIKNSDKFDKKKEFFDLIETQKLSCSLPF